MDTKLETPLFVDSSEGFVDIPNRVVLTAVVVAEDAGNTHGFIIDDILDHARIEGESLRTRYEETWLDVHVLEQFFPASLEHCCNNHVGNDASDFVYTESVLVPVPFSPTELQCEAAEQASLGRADTASSRIYELLIEVIWFRAIPKFRNHVQSIVVQLERLCINCLIREVNFQPHQCNFFFLRLKVHVDIRAGVESRIEIEEMIVLDHLSTISSITGPLGHSQIVLWGSACVYACGVREHGD